MKRNRRGFYYAHVSIIAAAIYLRITIKYFRPKSSAWSTHAIVESGKRSKVADNDHYLVWRSSLTDHAQHAVLGIIAVNPLEPRGLEVKLVESRLPTVEPIQVLQASLKALVRLIF